MKRAFVDLCGAIGWYIDADIFFVGESVVESGIGGGGSEIYVVLERTLFGGELEG